MPRADRVRFIPWYGGITKIPNNFSIGNYSSALLNHFIKIDDIKSATNTHKFWNYANYAENIDENYYELIPSISAKKQNLQKEIFNEFIIFDTQIIDIYNENSQIAVDSINIFTNKMLQISVNYINLNNQ